MASSKDPKKVAAIVGGGLLAMYLAYKYYNNGQSGTVNASNTSSNSNIREQINNGTVNTIQLPASNDALVTVELPDFIKTKIRHV